MTECLDFSPSRVQHCRNKININILEKYLAALLHIEGEWKEAYMILQKNRFAFSQGYTMH